jgi:nucleoside-diphosphate-sugar epimerase
MDGPAAVNFCGIFASEMLVSPTWTFARRKCLETLVTGANGFIGSFLVDRLIADGHRVRALVRRTSDTQYLDGKPVDIVYGEVIDPSSLEPAVRGVDIVFHVAGVTVSAEENRFFEVNVGGTKNLLESCLQHTPDLERFVYVSSSAAAGPAEGEGRKTEEDLCSPTTPYGKSKLAAERLVDSYCDRIRSTIARPTEVYGPRDDDILKFAKPVLKGVKPLICGGRQRISIGYVEDVCRGLVHMAESDKTIGEKYFISGDQTYSWRQIMDMIARTMHKRAFPLVVPAFSLRLAEFGFGILSKVTGKPPLISKGKTDELAQSNWTVSINKARRDFGYRPRCTLQEGLKLTLDWYKEVGWI